MTIYDYYKKPSKRKIDTFNYWQSYAFLNGYEFAVKSANVFNMTFVLWNEKTTLIITKSYISMYDTQSGQLLKQQLNNF